MTTSIILSKISTPFSTKNSTLFSYGFTNTNVPTKIYFTFYNFLLLFHIFCIVRGVVMRKYSYITGLLLLVLTLLLFKHNASAYFFAGSYSYDEKNQAENYNKVAPLDLNPQKETFRITHSNNILKDTVINGDLILSENIGEEQVILDNVTVSGRTVIKGDLSIFIRNNSSLNTVLASKITSTLKTDKTSSIAGLEIDEGIVYISGKVSKIKTFGKSTVTGDSLVCNEIFIYGRESKFSPGNKSIIDKIVLESLAEKGFININDNSKVSEILVKSQNVRIDVEDGRIETLNSTGDATRLELNILKEALVSQIFVFGKESKVYGEGELIFAAISGSNSLINTVGTRTVVLPGTTGVYAGGQAIYEGTSLITRKSNTFKSDTPLGTSGSQNTPKSIYCSAKVKEDFLELTMNELPLAEFRITGPNSYLWSGSAGSEGQKGTNGVQDYFQGRYMINIPKMSLNNYYYLTVSKSGYASYTTAIKPEDPRDKSNNVSVEQKSSTEDGNIPDLIVDNTARIIYLSTEISVESLKNALIKYPGAKWKVALSGDALVIEKYWHFERLIEQTGNIYSGNVLIVMAEDETTINKYRIYITSNDNSISAKEIGEPGHIPGLSTDNINGEIRGVPANTSVPKLKEALKKHSKAVWKLVSEDVSSSVIDNNDFKRVEETLEKASSHDVLIVAAENGCLKKYEIMLPITSSLDVTLKSPGEPGYESQMTMDQSEIKVNKEISIVDFKNAVKKPPAALWKIVYSGDALVINDLYTFNAAREISGSNINNGNILVLISPDGLNIKKYKITVFSDNAHVTAKSAGQEGYLAEISVDENLQVINGVVSGLSSERLKAALNKHTNASWKLLDKNSGESVVTAEDFIYAEERIVTISEACVLIILAENGTLKKYQVDVSARINNTEVTVKYPSDPGYIPGISKEGDVIYIPRSLSVDQLKNALEKPNTAQWKIVLSGDATVITSRFIFDLVDDIPNNVSNGNVLILITDDDTIFKYKILITYTLFYNLSENYRESEKNTDLEVSDDENEDLEVIEVIIEDSDWEINEDNQLQAIEINETKASDSLNSEAFLLLIHLTRTIYPANKTPRQFIKFPGLVF